MVKFLKPLLAILGLLILVGISCAGITNGNFETGDLTGWSPSDPSYVTISTEEVHSGSYSAKLNASAMDMGIVVLQQSPAPFDVSGFSFWYKINHTNGTQHDFTYEIRCFDISTITDTITTEGEWTQVSGYIDRSNTGLFLLEFEVDAHTLTDSEMIVFVDDVEFWYANFTANTTEGTLPLPVLFNNESVGSITGWYWLFGDGDSSTDEDPTHTYTSNGQYDVSLNISSTYWFAWYNQTDYITAYPLNASFSTNITEGFPPVVVEFTDLTDNGTATSWNWSFGDGEYSNDQNPIHTYDSWFGNAITHYTVVLNASDAYSYDLETKSDYITVYPLESNFTSNVTSGYAPSWAVVEFTANVTNGTATAWNWSFGDGYYSEDENPTHSYTSIGTYNVTLNASDSYSYDIEEKIDYITISSAPVPVAAFSADDTSGQVPHTVAFTDATTNTPTAWNWYYNIGSGWVLFNTSQNPVRTFSSIGTYHIKLVASNIYGSDTEEKTGYITVTEEEEPDWLPGYYYRAVINITANPLWNSSLTNYQVLFDVYVGSGSNSGNVIYTNNNAQTGLRDITFTDSDNNIIDHAIVYKYFSYTTFTHEYVYVEIPTISNSTDTQIYMYYGNPIAQDSTSSTDNALLFFDDFYTSLNTTRWNISVNTITPWFFTAANGSTSKDVRMESYMGISSASPIGSFYYDAYNESSIASQYQANFTPTSNFQVIAKVRSQNAYTYGVSESSYGIGLVGTDNLVSSFIGDYLDGSTPNYMLNRSFIETTKTDMHGGITQTTLIGIERDGETIRLKRSDSTDINSPTWIYVSNGTSADINKLSFITGSLKSTYLGTTYGGTQKNHIFYTIATNFILPEPVASVSSEEEYLDPGYIEYDRSTYAVSDTAIVTSDIPNVFWDTLNYTYAAHMFVSTDLVTPVKSWTITTQEHDESVDMGEFSAGTYYVYLYMYTISDGTTYLIDSDTATSYNAFILSGYTYDGPAGTILESTNVDILQSGTPHSNTSTETGYYEFDPLSIGSLISITGYKTGYENYTGSFTPEAGVRVVKNISLVPSDIEEYWNFTDNGTAAGGFVYVLPYNITATGAVVSLSNGTWTSSNLTIGPEGWYFFEGLANSETYNFSAALSPYVPLDETITTGTDDFTRTDFAFSAGTYDLTVYILDAATGGLMTANSTATINDGAGTILSYTTSNGTAIFNNTYGSYTLTVSSTGYDTETRTVLMDSDKYVVVTLSVTSEGGGTSTYYTPHEVRFIVQDNYGAGLSGTTVTITPTTSTLDTVVDWFQSLLGLPEDTGIQTEVLTGVTDSNGGINFVMVKEILYSIQCVNTAKGCSETRTLYPKDDAYVITCDTNDDFYQNSTIIQDNITWSFTNVSVNDSYETFIFSYYDPTGETTNVSFWVRTHASPLSTCHQEYAATPNSCSGSYTASCAGGAEYYTGCTVVSNTHGSWETMQVYHYPLFVDLGIDSGYYPYIAVAFLVVIAALFSVISVRFGAVLIPMFGFMFYYMRWLPFDIRGIGLLTLLLTIGVFAYIRKQEDKVGG